MLVKWAPDVIVMEQDDQWDKGIFNLSALMVDYNLYKHRLK